MIPLLLLEDGEETKACPFTGKEKRGIDIDEVDAENPSLAEYKKIKRVMGIMTQFYTDGTEFKKGHYDHVTGELAKLEIDLKMVEEQIQVLAERNNIQGHPKQKEYLSSLNGEKQRLEDQRQMFLTKQKDYSELSEWSQGIVQVCLWLEANLDEYCSKTLNYPKLKDCKPAPKLDKETALRYSSGLDEIYHNLQESQDFFEVCATPLPHQYIERRRRKKRVPLIERTGSFFPPLTLNSRLSRSLSHRRLLMAVLQNITIRKRR